jgi:hypothetical protein
MKNKNCIVSGQITERNQIYEKSTFHEQNINTIPLQEQWTFWNDHYTRLKLKLKLKPT